MTTALQGVRVLDLTRILAGPTCTQLLGDLGADVIKVERPGEGDDTRKWGPPYVEDEGGDDTSESAYYLACNRGKRSVAIDLADPEGQGLIRDLAARSHVVVENFKAGGLAKYGLDYEGLRAVNPALVYGSITGFGQTGPYRERAGYDFLAQGYGGIMSLTGEPEGEPVKVGVGVSDIVCGMYGAVAVLAALRHAEATGEGQHIDLSLLDSTVAWLAYEGTNYLVSGKVPKRQGNGHPNIVPYRTFESRDGKVILAVGNDGQFRRFCRFAGVEGLADDPRFSTNPARAKNRDALHARLAPVMAGRTTAEWVEGLSGIAVPCGPVNALDRVFADAQVRARGMRIEMPHPKAGSGTVPLLGNPIRMSATPVRYERPPPTLGQHTAEVLGEVLGLDGAALDDLRARGIIG
ncbi:MAG: CoA transferase [Geminicoccaceae bacterium]|nr:CoA transferase [Geminicoccaceae bacterium]